MFITTLFMVTKVQKQPNVHQQMGGSRTYGVYIPWATREAMIHIYIYIHVHICICIYITNNRILFSLAKGRSPVICDNGMNLEGITVHKISQMERKWCHLYVESFLKNNVELRNRVEKWLTGVRDGGNRESLVKKKCTNFELWVKSEDLICSMVTVVGSNTALLCD